MLLSARSVEINNADASSVTASEISSLSIEFPAKSRIDELSTGENVIVSTPLGAPPKESKAWMVVSPPVKASPAMFVRPVTVILSQLPPLELKV